MVSLLILGLMEFVRTSLVLSLIPLFGQQVGGYSLALIGTAISLHYLFDNIFRLPVGWLIDRYRRIRFLLIGILVSMAGVTLIFLHLNAYSFVLGAVLFGLGLSPLWPSVIVGVTAEIPTHKTGEALSKVFMAWLVGGGLGPLVTNFMIGKTYTNAFIAQFIVMLLALFLSCFASVFYEKTREYLSSRVFFSELFQEISSLKVLYPGMFVQTLSIGVLMPVITIYAHRIFGLSPEQFNYLLIGGGLFTVVLLIPAGKIADRMGVTKPLISGFVVAVICLILFPMQKVLINAVIIGAVLGIAYSFILPAWNGLLARAISPEKRATMWAVFMTIEGLGTAVGAFIGGRAWDTFGPKAPFYISAFFLGIMAVFYAFGNIEKLFVENRAEQVILENSQGQQSGG
jgi:DHA1 family multidrug resistance protein-like MFS transporter